MDDCRSYEPLIERLLADEIDDPERDRLLAHAGECEDLSASAHAEFADEYLADLRDAVAEVAATGATAADTRARYS